MHSQKFWSIYVSSLRTIYDEASIQLLNNKQACFASKSYFTTNQLKQTKKHKVVQQFDSLQILYLLLKFGQTLKITEKNESTLKQNHKSHKTTMRIAESKENSTSIIAICFVAI